MSTNVSHSFNNVRQGAPPTAMSREEGSGGGGLESKRQKDFYHLRDRNHERDYKSNAPSGETL